MSKITVSDNSKGFIKEGKPFFYLADTVWMAFSKLTEGEWREYLHVRKTQGFNVVQVSLFPLDHDNSADKEAIDPFVRDERGVADYTKRQDSYFEKAEKMVAMAADYGITTAIHLMWAHLIPGSWACEGHPEWTIPRNLLYPIFRQAVDQMKKYEPIYAISGDIRFENDAVTEYCLEVLRAVEDADPNAMTTLHLAPGQQPGEELILHPSLTFYSYQSGHSYMDQDNPEKFSRQFLQQPVKRPIVNTEPCYEGHKNGYREGRFTAADVRRAALSSIMTGAGAGATYGAHGLWSCHRRGNVFHNIGFSGVPYDFKTALHFPGAWDYSFIKTIIERFDLFFMEPMQELLEDPIPGCYAAGTKGKLAVYLPYNAQVTVKRDLTEYRSHMVIFEGHHVGVPDVETAGGMSVIAPHEFNSDVWYLFEKRS